MGDAKMTKGYARVVCENGHDIWGGETVEEAQKCINTQCMVCDADPEENFVRHIAPRVIPPTEIATLRAENARLREAAKALYYAAHWTPDRDVDAVKLWTDLRDAAGFEPGNAPARRALEEG
jgi:hypothetical protein